MELKDVEALALDIISKLENSITAKKTDVTHHEGAVEGIKLFVQELGKKAAEKAPEAAAGNRE